MHHRLGPETWLRRRYKNLNEVIELKGIGIELLVSQFYEQIEFEATQIVNNKPLKAEIDQVDNEIESEN